MKPVVGFLQWRVVLLIMQPYWVQALLWFYRDTNGPKSYPPG